MSALHKMDSRLDTRFSAVRLDTRFSAVRLDTRFSAFCFAEFFVSRPAFAKISKLIFDWLLEKKGGE